MSKRTVITLYPQRESEVKKWEIPESQYEYFVPFDDFGSLFQSENYLG